MSDATRRILVVEVVYWLRQVFMSARHILPALLSSVLFSTAAVVPANANELSLSIQGGRVTLIADSVTVRQILAEWARVGQTRIVNGERVTGPPVSLRLIDVPEQQALDIVLRSVSGYMAAPRAVMAGHLSSYDRILIMPTSVAPPAPPPTATRGAPRQQPYVPPAPQPADAEPTAEDIQIEEAGEEQNTPEQPMPPGFNPGRVVPGGPAQPAPVEEQEPSVPQPFPGAPTTAARPGEIVAPPQPQPNENQGPFAPRPTNPPPPQSPRQD